MPINFDDIYNNKVDDLDLIGSIFTIEFATKLANSLKLNTSIRKLDLSFCNLTDPEFEVIAKSLSERSKSLEVLNIEDNLLTSKSAPFIIELLNTGKVNEVKISNNNFDNESTEYHDLIKAMLKINQTSGGKNPLASTKSTEPNSISTSLRTSFFPSANSSNPSSDSSKNNSPITHKFGLDNK